MKARLRRIRDTISQGRRQCTECKRGYRFRTVSKPKPGPGNVYAPRVVACRWCEMKAAQRLAPPANFKSFMEGIRNHTLIKGPFRRVIAFNRRWNTALR